MGKISKHMGSETPDSVDDLGGDLSSVGTDSSTFTKNVSPRQNIGELDPLSPAPTTANPSERDQTDSSTALLTDGGPMMTELATPQSPKRRRR
jgi:hypothetical protein